MYLREAIISSNTGLDAIKRAPIVSCDSGIKCLRIQDISQNKNFQLWGNTKVDKKTFCNFQLKKNDIIIARTGSTIGVNKFIKHDLNSVYNNGLICLKINKNFIPYFIYLFLQTNKYNFFVKGISGSSATQPNMRINDLLMLEIPKYDLTTQQHIVDTIPSLLPISSSLSSRVLFLHLSA